MIQRIYLLLMLGGFLKNCFTFFVSNANYRAKLVNTNIVQSTTSDLKEYEINSLLRIAFVQHPYVGENHLIDESISGILHHQYQNLTIDILPMPNIYELNDKRFEKRWLDYIKELNLYDRYDLVIATESGKICNHLD